MNCDAVDWDTPARAWMCFKHTPTSSAGCSCGGKDAGSFNQRRMHKRAGCPNALNTCTSSSSPSSLTPPAYRHFTIYRYRDTA